MALVLDSRACFFLLVVANVFLIMIWYELYRQRSQQEHFRQQSDLQKKCSGCMSYVEEWWNANATQPLQQKKITDAQAQEMYKEMTQTIIWLAAPCIAGWWNNSRVKMIQNAMGLKGLKMLNVQIKQWWNDNVFKPNKMTDQDLQNIQSYLLNKFNSCVEEETPKVETKPAN